MEVWKEDEWSLLAALEIGKGEEGPTPEQLKAVEADRVKFLYTWNNTPGTIHLEQAPTSQIR
jgi:hypothetical protein